MAESKRKKLILRWILAGPVAIVVSVLALAGMPLWFPPGAGDVNHLVIPLASFPLIWSALFFHAVLDRNLIRVALISTLVAVLNGAFIALRFMDGTA